MIKIFKYYEFGVDKPKKLFAICIGYKEVVEHLDKLDSSYIH